MVLAASGCSWLDFGEQTSSHPLPAPIPAEISFLSLTLHAGRWGPTPRTGAEWSGRTDPVCKKMPPLGYGHFVLAAIDPSESH